MKKWGRRTACPFPVPGFYKTMMEEAAMLCYHGENEGGGRVFTQKKPRRMTNLWLFAETMRDGAVKNWSMAALGVILLVRKNVLWACASFLAWVVCTVAAAITKWRRVRRQERLLGVRFQEAVAAFRYTDKRHAYGDWFICVRPVLVFHRGYVSSVQLEMYEERQEPREPKETFVYLTVFTVDGRKCRERIPEYRSRVAYALKRWATGENQSGKKKQEDPSIWEEDA